jgi:hypothetical protein
MTSLWGKRRHCAAIFHQFLVVIVSTKRMSSFTSCVLRQFHFHHHNRLSTTSWIHLCHCHCWWWEYFESELWRCNKSVFTTWSGGSLKVLKGFSFCSVLRKRKKEKLRSTLGSMSHSTKHVDPTMSAWMWSGHSPGPLCRRVRLAQFWLGAEIC